MKSNDCIPASAYFGRRDFLKWSALSGLGWLTPVSHLLARKAEFEPGSAQSIIVLWLDGGPSQLETFDPHPGKYIAGGTKAIKTAAKGIQLADLMPRLAEQMESVSLIRSMVSKEGDHERGTYTMKTGYRPDPTVIHPSIGAICCHELPGDGVDIPRHVSILPSRWPARGGLLGDAYDAFKTGDPLEKLPDINLRVNKTRDQLRQKNLSILEKTFAKGRSKRLTGAHQSAMKRARAMMTSEQLKAFEIDKNSTALKAYGDTPFGRGCLAARQLIQEGVRCVEVTLRGWDTHAANHTAHQELVGALDPAFSALIHDLQEHKLFDKTMVLCMGEFGRTPRINPASGRDHWPHGFSLAIGGGGIRGGRVVGETDPEGSKLDYDSEKTVKIGDLYATVLTALGIRPSKVNPSPIGRPIAVTDHGTAVAELLS